MRAIGPALINSLYSLSMKKGYLGGYLVYYILMLIGMICLHIGWLLPDHANSRRRHRRYATAK